MCPVGTGDGPSHATDEEGRESESIANESVAGSRAAQSLPIVSGWNVIEQIGEGGFGEVYSARRVSDGQLAALKIARDPDDPRFVRERQALEAVGPPATPRFIAAGHLGSGHPWIAMEHLAGCSLGEWMRGLPDAGACSAPTAMAILTLIADALEQIHAAGIVHRDLKPSNIYLGDDVVAPTRAVILDFGIAGAAPGGERMTATGWRLGTVMYSAPEQLTDAHSADKRADVYALAVIAFELLTGRRPFVGTAGEVERAHATERVPRASSLASLPRAIDAVLSRGMAKIPTARPPSANAFVEQLRAALDSELMGEPRAAAAGLVASPSAPVGTPRDALRDAPLAAQVDIRRVAILGVYDADAVVLAEAARALHGRVVRTTGGCVLVAFDRADSPAAGLRNALAAARALAAQVRVVVHLVEVQVRARKRRVRLHSPALDAPDWLPPAEAWEQGLEPIVLTAIAAETLGAHGGSAALDDFRVPAPIAPETPQRNRITYGRVECLTGLVTAARRGLAEQCSGLHLLIGEPGMGKSHILRGFVNALAADVKIVSLNASGDSSALFAVLLSTALGVDVDVAAKGGDLEALRATCEERFGAGLVGRAWVALSARLAGHAQPVDTCAVRAPGAARFALTELLSAGLRRAAAAQAKLIICVDDAESAQAVVLDALELATFDDGDVGPWVCVAASPVLLTRRPDFGRRSANSERHTLQALSDDSARALLRELLYPVDRAPIEALDMIVQMADGIPGHLIEVVSGLRASGAIRQRTGSSGWYLATDDFLESSSNPLAERVAERELSALTTELRSFAATAAVLGGSFDAAEVDEVRARMELVEQCDYGRTDTSVALVRLFCQGLLRESGPGRYRFRDGMVQRGIEAWLAPQLRVHLHDAVYRWLDSCPLTTSDELARLARHAIVAGHRRAGARAWFDAATRDAAIHEYTRAERRFSAAVAQLNEPDELRMRALTARARMRARLVRWGEALDDVRSARQLARALGDRAAEVNALLSEAEILDWSYHWAEATTAVQHAVVLAEGIDDRRLAAGCLLARGRCAFRQESHTTALQQLEAAARVSAEIGDHDIQVMARLLIPVSLIYADDAAAAEAHFEEVVSLCEETHDFHHLAVALNNRVILWKALDSPERALADARRASELARRIGHTTLESTADHNLAELLYYRGEFDEALVLATRARDLYHRHAARPGPEHDLLVTRIRVARGEEGAVAEAQETLRACAPDTWSEAAQLVFDALVTPAEERETWCDIVTRARAVVRGFPNEHLDVLCMAMHAARAAGRDDDVRTWLQEAQAVATAGRQPWSQQLATMAASIRGQT